MTDEIKPGNTLAEQIAAGQARISELKRQQDLVAAQKREQALADAAKQRADEEQRLFDQREENRRSEERVALREKEKAERAEKERREKAETERRLQAEISRLEEEERVRKAQEDEVARLDAEARFLEIELARMEREAATVVPIQENVQASPAENGRALLFSRMAQSSSRQDGLDGHFVPVANKLPVVVVPPPAVSIDKDERILCDVLVEEAHSLEVA